MCPVFTFPPRSRSGSKDPKLGRLEVLGKGYDRSLNEWPGVGNVETDAGDFFLLPNPLSLFSRGR